MGTPAEGSVDDDAIDHAEPRGALVLGGLLILLVIVIWLWAFLILLSR